MGVLNPSTFTILTYRPFEPTEISGLKGWWKADSIDQADNTSVSAWLDSSGNEAHMYQSSATAQPTLQTNELNGYPVVRFDGTNDFMNLTAPFDYLTNNTVGVLNATSCSPDGTYFVHANASASPTIVIYKKTGNVFNKLTNPATLPNGTVYSSNFSNDGNYLAVPSGLSPFIQIYKRTGDTFTKLANPANLPTGAGFYAHWSHDDSFLIVAHSSSPNISIYSVNKLTDTFTKLANPSSLPIGVPWVSKFSTNKSFLSIGINASPFIEFYSISGTTFTKLTAPTTIPASEVYSISWIDDTTCAVASGATLIRIYQYDYALNKFELLTSFAHGVGTVTALEYSRDKNFLGVGGGSNPFFKVFSRNGTTYTALSNPATIPTGSGRGIAWGANDNTIVVSHSVSPNIQAYTFDGTTLTNLTKLNMFRNVGGGTVFLIIKYDVTTLNSQSFFVSTTNSSPSRFLVGWQFASNKFQVGGRRLDTNSFQNVLSTTTATTNFYIQTGLIDYSNSDASVFINGKLENTNTSFQTNGLTSDTNSLQIILGNVGGSEWFKGDVSEIIAFNRTLTTAEIRDVHYYLSAKYNINLAT